MAADVLRITDDTTRAELAEAIGHLNTTAKAIRRRGFVGTRGGDYAVMHGRINALLDDWQAAS